MGDLLNFKFKKLFKSSNPVLGDLLDDLTDARVTPEQNSELLRIPTVEEVRKATWEIHPLKAPGPDGMSCCFFRNH